MRTSPNPWEALNASAKGYYVQKKYNEALNRWSEVLTFSREMQEGEKQVVFSNRVACHLKMGNARAAVGEAKTCININPLWSKGHVRLASSYIALRDHNMEATAALRRALECDGDNKVAQEMLAQLLKKKNPRTTKDKFMELSVVALCLALLVALIWDRGQPRIPHRNHYDSSGSSQRRPHEWDNFDFRQERPNERRHRRRSSDGNSDRFHQRVPNANGSRPFLYRNHCRQLGLNPHQIPFTNEEIKQAYRAKAKEYHPDKNPSPQAAARFNEIHVAYEALRNCKLCHKI